VRECAGIEADEEALLYSIKICVRPEAEAAQWSGHVWD